MEDESSRGMRESGQATTQRVFGQAASKSFNNEDEEWGSCACARWPEPRHIRLSSGRQLNTMPILIRATGKSPESKTHVLKILCHTTAMKILILGRVY